MAIVEARSTRGEECPDCGAEVAPQLLSCPGCHRLVHADRLKELAGQAELFEASGQPAGAMGAWRSALVLLPPASKQYEAIRRKIDDIGRALDAAGGTGSEPTGGSKPAWAGLGGIGGVALLILGKGKFLLLGLTKASTLLSMVVSFGAYWSLWGWPLALGVILSIYIHEMGHVAALVRYGIKADARMFIPGQGAVIRARQHLASPREDARVGLAGPAWGLGAALACAAGSFLIDQPMLAAIARLGAVINLFNLIPIWQLDGGRAFNALGRSDRWLAAIAASAAWAITEESFLMFLLLGAAYRAAFTPPAPQSDRPTLVAYVALVALLSVLTQIPVPMP